MEQSHRCLKPFRGMQGHQKITLGRDKSFIKKAFHAKTYIDAQTLLPLESSKGCGDGSESGGVHSGGDSGLIPLYSQWRVKMYSATGDQGFDEESGR